MVPDTAYAIARNFLKWAPNITIGPDNKPLYCRFRCLYYLNLSGESIYGLLMVDAGNTTLADAGQKIEVWKEAIKSLLRYALNLKLAPKRPEFQRMKVCQWTCCVCMCVCMVSVYVYVYAFDVHGILMTTWLQSCCPIIHKEPLYCVMQSCTCFFLIGVLFTTISLHVYIITDMIKNRISIKHKLFTFPSLSALELILCIPGS